MNGIVRTIVLSGNDSISFANSIFRPTHNEIIAARERMNFLDESIELKDNESGFVANIPALDLSFLDETAERARLFTFDITMNVNENLPKYFYANEKNQKDQKVKIHINNDYCDSPNSDFIMIAA